MSTIPFFIFCHLNVENGTKSNQVIYCLIYCSIDAQYCISITNEWVGKMTPKINKNWNFASKWILDEKGGKFFTTTLSYKTTFSMHISVPYLAQYTDKANIFPLNVNIRGSSNK